MTRTQKINPRSLGAINLNAVQSDRTFGPLPNTKVRLPRQALDFRTIYIVGLAREVLPSGPASVGPFSCGRRPSHLRGKDGAVQFVPTSLGI
jgi:hypothetical protein